jgi:hypothetical protein
MKENATRIRENLSVVACSLTRSEIADRRRGLADEIFNGTVRTKELEDGYEFVFPGGAGWPAKLARMIEAERECCPFLTFALFFERDGGPISLRVTGPDGAKAFIVDEIMPS